MNKSSKILATTFLVFVFVILLALMQAGSGPGGRSYGIIGFALIFGLIAGIKAIWSSNNDDNNSDNNMPTDDIELRK